jgi:hypothetical protein
MLEHFVSFFSLQTHELQRFVSTTSSMVKEHFGGEFESTKRTRKIGENDEKNNA